MSEQFDTNKKVTLNFFGCCSYKDSWTAGEPLPAGWGLTESNVKENAYVTVYDYDLLLADRNNLKAALDQVDDVLVVNWVGPRVDGDYRKALHDLVEFNIQIATDPAVNGGFELGHTVTGTKYVEEEETWYPGE